MTKEVCLNDEAFLTSILNLEVQAMWDDKVTTGPL